ncbi:MAG: DUF4388 domain-containing protein [Kofleriaceae bacterium]
MLLARGSVTDRPWGQTLGALGMKHLTGQLTVVSEGKEYAIVFHDGAIVAAASPAVADAAVRIALTNHLISKTQVPDLTRRIAAAPDRDDVDVIAEATKLSPEHVDQLRRKVTAQRAARSFSLETGEFSVMDEVQLATVPDVVGIDVRAVIYLGARLNVTAPAMTEALRVFGDAYILKKDAEATLSLFEFAEPVEMTILAELRAGTSLPEIEAAHRDIDPRTAEAMVYALMSVGACQMQDAPVIPRAGTATIKTQPALKRPTMPPAAARVNRDSSSSFGPYVSRTQSIQPVPAVGRTPTPTSAIRREFDDGTATPAAMRASRGHTDAPPSTGRASTPSMASGTNTGTSPTIASGTQNRQTPRLGTSSPTNPHLGRASASIPTLDPPTGVRAPTGDPAGRAPTGDPGRTPTGDPVTGRAPTPPSLGRAPTPSAPSVGRATTNSTISRTTTLRKTKALIAARTILFDQGADHFALLGVPFDAPFDIVRTTYLNLSRQLHPDKLAELGVDDAGGVAGRLFAQMGLAFAVLTDQKRRLEYMASLLRPDVALPPAAPPPPPARTMTSEESLAEAAEAFKRGEVALRRDEPIEACLAFAKAVELQPNNTDYGGLLGWSQFCAATDKAAAAPKARQALDKMINKSDKPIRGRFLLGRVERMLGNDQKAKYHFELVIYDQPNHAEAQAEIRAIDQRAKNKR